MIFVDSSFWIALAKRADAHHAAAVALAKRHEAATFTTSNHVRGETWTFLRRRFGHAVAVASLDDMARLARLAIVHVTDELEADALTWLRRHDERPYSFVDATSFAVMRSLGIHEALAFGDDFAAAGFVELRP